RHRAPGGAKLFRGASGGPAGVRGLPAPVRRTEGGPGRGAGMSVKGMTSEGVFSGRLLAIWISASVALLAASLYFMLMPEGTRSGTDSVGPTAFSRSALGYAGIAEILQQLGFRVVKSRYGSLGNIGEGDLLVVAE